jgi:O-acetyl-ADP-ribose deacetylase (regulator of RNase III)
MIRYITGNLLDAPSDALVNTVNTVGVMGKGIALQFKEAFPYNMKVYLDACKKETFHIGDLLVVKDHNALLGEKWIVNFPTKKHWRHPSKYEYIEAGLNALPETLIKYNIKSIALPPLGCGNGGLDWEKVRPMMEEKLGDLNIDILVYVPNPAIKQLLQQQETKKDVQLTPARAMLLYALFHYESLGEYSSLFSANKLAYFLKRMGEDHMSRLQFKAHHYGPYADGVGHVLYALNGVYLKGLEQREAGSYEPLLLEYSRFEDVKNYIARELTSAQRNRLDNLIHFIQGFESELSLEVLASVAFILEQAPNLSLDETIVKIQEWNNRKKNLFKKHYIEIAYNHLKDLPTQQGLFAVS